VLQWVIPRTESIEITPEILSPIAGIDEFKGSWRVLGTLTPERLSAWRRSRASARRRESRAVGPKRVSGLAATDTARRGVRA